MPAIQPGTKLACMKANDRNDSGRTRAVAAAINVSRVRVTSDSPLDRAAKATAMSTAPSTSMTTPGTPLGKLAPRAQPNSTMMIDCTTVVKAW
jgi:hypothetical protein